MTEVIEPDGTVRLVTADPANLVVIPEAKKRPYSFEESEEQR